METSSEGGGGPEVNLPSESKDTSKSTAASSVATVEAITQGTTAHGALEALADIDTPTLATDSRGVAYSTDVWANAPTYRDIDPGITTLATKPDSLPPKDRVAAFMQAQHEAVSDASQNKIIVEVGGKFYWGGEHPNVWTANGTIRGKFETVPADKENWLPDMELASMFSDIGGDKSHVLIQFDDGNQAMIRKTTPDVLSGAHQKFDLASTKGLESGRNGRRELDTQILKDVVAVPGQPLRLGNTVSDSPVARITTVAVTEKGEVDPARLTQLKKNGRFDRVLRDPFGGFNNAMKAAREAGGSPQP